MVQIKQSSFLTSTIAFENNSKSLIIYNQFWPLLSSQKFNFWRENSNEIFSAIFKHYDWFFIYFETPLKSAPIPMWSTPTTFLMWLICSAEEILLCLDLEEWRRITWLELLTDHVLDVSIEVIAVLDNEAVIKIHHDYASIDFLIKENTVFENHPKKSHSKLRAKRATFTFH